MKIILYCQHVLGIGHFFRSLEICRSLVRHDVILVTGGAAVDVPLPPHVRNVRLPALMMDRDFSRLHTTDPATDPATDPDRSLDDIKKQRQRILYNLFQEERPDLFLLELYPFGRKAFRFEIDPVLKGLRGGDLPACRVVCSLRDILVEKNDPEKYESRVRDTLNRYFDALLVHADPRMIRLEETFTTRADIETPVEYTGFVAQKPARNSRVRFRTKLGIGEGEQLLVASAGGGSVGLPLLEGVLEAFQLIKTAKTLYLHLFSGPYLDDGSFNRLAAYGSDTIKVARFTPDFLSYLSAADLSVSMAGYNTSMDILSTGVPALVWPFPQNREQRLRAGLLEKKGWLSLLEDQDLAPEVLAERMTRMLPRKKAQTEDLPDLDGAANTARYLETLLKPATGK